MTELCSCILSGPAPVHTRHKRCVIGYPIFPGTSQLNTLQDFILHVFSSAAKSEMFNLIRVGLNLKGKQTTLKYYIYQSCLLSTHRCEDASKILFKVLKIIETEIVMKQVNWPAQLYKDNSLLEPAAGSSPVLLLTS